MRQRKKNKQLERNWSKSRCKKQLTDANTPMKYIKTMDQDLLQNRQIKQCEKIMNRKNRKETQRIKGCCGQKGGITDDIRRRGKKIDAKRKDI